MRGRTAKYLLLSLIVSVFFATCIRPGLANAQADAAALTKAIQSIALMTVETSKGSKASGLAFVSLGENRAVTALHLLKDARKVTLRFPSGEEVSSAGIVDLDENRGIALIDLPGPGRNKLNIEQVRISPGTVVNCAAAREGTFGFIRLSVSEVHQGTDGVERYILSGESFSGNSGTPALDVKGNVIGMVIELGNSRILVPSAFIVALDSSLPLRQWENQVSATAAAESATPGPGPMDGVDVSILEFLILWADHYVIYQWADEITRGHGYLQGVPQDLYNFQTKLEVALRRIKEVQTDDPKRLTLLKNLQEAGANQYIAAEHMMKAIVAGQQAKDWGPQSQDLQKRSKAALVMTEELLASQKSILREIYGSSAPFRDNIPKELVYSLVIEPRPSLFRLGTYSPMTNPLYLSIVYRDSFAATLGLKPGDRLISAAGIDLDPKGSIEEFKMIVQNNLGETIPVTLEREGKKTELKMQIPKEIPSSFLY